MLSIYFHYVTIKKPTHNALITLLFCVIFQTHTELLLIRSALALIRNESETVRNGHLIRTDSERFGSAMVAERFCDRSGLQQL
jgi:K+-transporting ATPase c subunit